MVMMAERPKGQVFKVGFYDIERTIGKGNFAVVKLARHRVTKSEVAIKIIDKAKLNSSNLEKVRREIAIMKLLKHPHIIKLYQVMETQNVFYLVTEYAPKGEIFDYIAQHGKMDEEPACKKFSQIISAVDYCHKQGVVHRDLKAENLLLDANMNIKIADFGFGNFDEPGKVFATWCGSPPYAAPELFEGEQYQGPQADIWSLGVVLYVLVCGTLPFDAPTVPGIRDMVLCGRFRIPFFMSEDCENLVRRMLVRDPLKRFTMEQIRKHRWMAAANPPPIIAPLRSSSSSSNLLSNGSLGDGLSGPQHMVLSPVVDISDVHVEEKQEEEIVRLMDKLGIDQQKTKESILNKSYDNYTAIFDLLLESLKRQRSSYQPHGMEKRRRPSTVADQALTQEWRRNHDLNSRNNQPNFCAEFSRGTTDPPYAFFHHLNGAAAATAAAAAGFDVGFTRPLVASSQISLGSPASSCVYTSSAVGSPIMSTNSLVNVLADGTIVNTVANNTVENGSSNVSQGSTGIGSVALSLSHSTNGGFATSPNFNQTFAMTPPVSHCVPPAGPLDEGLEADMEVEPVRGTVITSPSRVPTSVTGVKVGAFIGVKPPLQRRHTLTDTMGLRDYGTEMMLRTIGTSIDSGQGGTEFSGSPATSFESNLDTDLMDLGAGLSHLGGATTGGYIPGVHNAYLFNRSAGNGAANALSHTLSGDSQSVGAVATVASPRGVAEGSGGVSMPPAGSSFSLVTNRTIPGQPGMSGAAHLCGTEQTSHLQQQFGVSPLSAMESAEQMDHEPSSLEELAGGLPMEALPTRRNCYHRSMRSPINFREGRRASDGLATQDLIAFRQRLKDNAKFGGMLELRTEPPSGLSSRPLHPHHQQQHHLIQKAVPPSAAIVMGARHHQLQGGAPQPIVHGAEEMHSFYRAQQVQAQQVQAQQVQAQQVQAQQVQAQQKQQHPAAMCKLQPQYLEEIGSATAAGTDRSKPAAAACTDRSKPALAKRMSLPTSAFDLPPHKILALKHSRQVERRLVVRSSHPLQNQSAAAAAIQQQHQAARQALQQQQQQQPGQLYMPASTDVPQCITQGQQQMVATTTSISTTSSAGAPPSWDTLPLQQHMMHSRFSKKQPLKQQSGLHQQFQQLHIEQGTIIAAGASTGSAAAACFAALVGGKAHPPVARQPSYKLAQQQPVLMPPFSGAADVIPFPWTHEQSLSLFDVVPPTSSAAVTIAAVAAAATASLPVSNVMTATMKHAVNETLGTVDHSGSVGSFVPHMASRETLVVVNRSPAYVTPVTIGELSANQMSAEMTEGSLS